MDKYQKAFEMELAWLDDDIQICEEMIKKIDDHKNVGYPRKHLFDRKLFASDEKRRLTEWLEIAEKRNLSNEEE